jgi:hypothetical protein
MNEGANELWANAICAVMKSDLIIHANEIESLRSQLLSKKLFFLEFGIETDALLKETMNNLQDTSIGAEDHFQIVKEVLENLKIIDQKKTLSALLKLCISIAYEVNQLNKKELVMLSRLEQQFKKF